MVSLPDTRPATSGPSRVTPSRAPPEQTNGGPAPPAILKIGTITMTDTTDTPAVDGGAAFTVPDYRVAPEDEHHATAILSLDPFKDIASAGSVSGGVRLSSALPSLEALSPQMRSEVAHELQSLPAARRADGEAQAIAKVLENHGRKVRALIGNGQGSTPYHDTSIEIAGEVRAATREFDRIAASMTEVARYEVDELGKPRPVYAMSDGAQFHARNRLAELSYRIGLLVTPEGNHGVEAQRRLDKALVEAVEARKAVTAQAEELREAEALAEKLNRDERIAALAKGIAKHKRTTLL